MALDVAIRFFEIALAFLGVYAAKRQVGPLVKHNSSYLFDDILLIAEEDQSV